MLITILVAVVTALGVAYWRATRRFARLQLSLATTVRDTQAKLEDMTAQNALDQNINFLRQSLAAFGPPRLAADGLYFGPRKINGSPFIVDEVRKRFGGAATIFMGDERVATNVETPEGGRALGTRLAAGPVRDQVLGKKISYRGETQILGETYVAVYEPIIADGAAIGILFAGTKKSAVTRTPPPTGIDQCIQKISDIANAQAETAIQAIQLRQEADDQRRMMDAERQTLARQQEIALDELAGGLGALAAGDLCTLLETPFTGDYERLRKDFNGAVIKLKETMRAVVQNSQNVRTGSSEITKSLDNLARQAEQQAAALEQSAAALGEITATVDQTAAGAAEAQGFVAQTNAAAEHSTTVLAETVATMSGIETSSKQITSIIGVMDEIAFQTNLLALNAGVEAARAGDSGRGFAVVATEVRALAQRSADAAKEIKQLIAVSREQVTTGVRLVAETTQSLAQITTRVQQLDERIQKFATAARDESASLKQISAAVTAMDQSMQHNAALVEESTAASHHLASEAATLADQAAHFKIVPAPPGNAAKRARQQKPALSEVS